jgi:PIN domain nuclease of toxin-antitoxin system
MEEVSIKAGILLLQYGVLGIITIAFFVLIWWVLKSHRKDKEAMIFALKAKDQAFYSAVSEFTMFMKEFKEDIKILKQEQTTIKEYVLRKSSKD